MTEKHINALYDFHDGPRNENVVTFHPPLGREGEEMLADICALMDDPQTRPYTREILREALHHIASHFVEHR